MSSSTAAHGVAASLSDFEMYWAASELEADKLCCCPLKFFAVEAGLCSAVSCERPDVPREASLMGLAVELFPGLAKLDRGT